MIPVQVPCDHRGSKAENKKDRANVQRTTWREVTVLRNCQSPGAVKYRVWCPTSCIWQVLLQKGTCLVIWLGWLAAQDYSLHKRSHPVKSSFCWGANQLSSFIFNTWHTMISVQGRAACITGTWVLRSCFQYKITDLKQRSPSGSK